MNKEHGRIMLAVAVVLGGSVMLLRSYLSTRPPPVAERVVVPASVEVQEALDPARFSVRPSREEVPDVLAGIHKAVVEQSAALKECQGVGVSLDDLGDAFVERLQFMLSPEAERDYLSISSRGDPRNFEAWESRFRKRIENNSRLPSLPALDPTGVTVSVPRLNRDGKLVGDKRHLGQGFGVLTGRGVVLSVVPNDPVSEGMLVVEVVLPMERWASREDQYVPTIQGYRFAWQPRMAKWIPFESVVYTQPGRATTAPPL